MQFISAFCDGAFIQEGNGWIHCFSIGRLLVSALFDLLDVNVLFVQFQKLLVSRNSGFATFLKAFMFVFLNIVFCAVYSCFV